MTGDPRVLLNLSHHSSDRWAAGQMAAAHAVAHVGGIEPFRFARFREHPAMAAGTGPAEEHMDNGFALSWPAADHLRSRSRKEFEQDAEKAIEAFQSAGQWACVTPDRREVYRREVLPFECERLRREAAERAQAGEPPADLLLVTVGDQPDAPMLATIATPARRLAFLHTDGSRQHAVKVCSNLGLDPGRAELVSVGDGKDVPEFYRIVLDLWARCTKPDRVVVDLTGGFKTMSAAAAVAAFCIPKAEVCYIDAEKVTIAGHKYEVRERRLSLPNPIEVFGRLRRDTARRLLAAGKWGAAAEAYQEIANSVRDSKPDELRARLARAYQALDSLALKEAEDELAPLCDMLDRLASTMARDAVVIARHRIRANLEGVRRLRKIVTVSGAGRNDPDPGLDLALVKSPEFLDFLESLRATASRMLAEKATDMAALLAYRVMEGVVQRRLAVRADVVTKPMDWERLAKAANLSLEDLLEKYNKSLRKGDRCLDQAVLGSDVDRAVGYRLLAVAFPGDVADALTPEKFAGIGNSRNRSRLAHGFQQLDEDAAQRILDEAGGLLKLVLDLEHVSPADRAALAARHDIVRITE